MAIRFHTHALDRMKERGASKEEVTATIEYGEHFKAKFDRTDFRRNFHYQKKWRNKK